VDHDYTSFCRRVIILICQKRGVDGLEILSGERLLQRDHVLDSGGNPATWYGGEIIRRASTKTIPFPIPEQLAVDGRGQSFVANRGGCTILMIPAERLGERRWRDSWPGNGKAPTEPEADGWGRAPTAAILNSPRGNDVDGAGNLS